MTDHTSIDGYDIAYKEGRIIITFPKAKFDFIRISLYEAFKAVFKRNWEIFDEHYAAVDEFNRVLEAAQKEVNIFDVLPYKELSKEYLKKYKCDTE